jgi:hypothetical protein
MMDLDTNSDLIYQKLTTACEKSNTLLYKKALALVKGIRENSKSVNFEGVNGLKTYTKCLLDLLQAQSAKIVNLGDDELKNRETLIFLLAICVKQMPFVLLRKISGQIISILEVYLQIRSFFVKKYSVIILERLLLSRSEEELKDDNDLVLGFYMKFFFTVITDKSDDLHKCLIKSFGKIMKTPKFVDYTNMTLMQQLKNFLTIKIRGLNLVDNVKLVGQEVKALTTTEGEFMLRFLCSVLQFLPFAIVNDIVLELNDLIAVCENKHILLNVMLCLDVAFNIKKFALETVEKIIKTLLARDFLIIEEEDSENALTIAYVKAITQVLLNMSKTNIISAVRYMTSIVSIIGEYFSSLNGFLKNTVYNCLYTVFNTIFSSKNLESLLSYYSNDNMELEFELSLTKPDKFDFNATLEKISACLMYLISDRFEEYRHACNLLYTFLERIHKFPILQPIVENIISKLSENEKVLKNETFKVFIAKCFNIISSSLIMKYINLQILDFDIASDNYTETSKVWLISYIDNFLKPTNDVQTLQDFFNSFYMEIKDIDMVIKRIKGSMSDNNMEIEEELDENFIVSDDTPFVKNLKIKRYELILGQIWKLTSKFTNYCQGYDLCIKELFDYYSQNNDESLYFILFKTVSKVIQVAGRQKDMKAIEVLKKEGKAFFTKSLNMLINQKLNSHIKEAFYLISNFCKIFSETYLTKIICDMIEKFENAVKLIPEDNESYNSNKAKLNEDIYKSKKFNILPLRIDIINLVLLNVTIVDTSNSKLIELLGTFFDNFYCFSSKVNKMHNAYVIKKKLIDLFLIMLEKMGDYDKVLDTFNSFVNTKKGLDNTNSKQKAKLFEFILKILIQKLKQNERIDADTVQSQFTILVEIVSLTKDMNRKVRNMAYEMIGETTDFMTESNLFSDWVRMIFALLTSNSSYLKSASINALARIFWAKRDDTSVNQLLQDTAGVVILLFKENSKEITKSVFLFLRVLLYQKIEDIGLMSKILHDIFNVCNESIRNEFKVKIRNLIKSLVIKFGFDEVRKIFPKEQENLLLYVNKHIVKKLRTMSKEDEMIYGNVKLDDSVMMDNEENLIDEEEEYIEKEFKKTEKRKLDEDRIFGKLDKIQLEEDDPEVVKRITEKLDKKPDKIEELFKRDNIELENFFYINPYAKEAQEGTKTKEKGEKDNDVVFDRRKGKIVVKDLHVYKDKKNTDAADTGNNILGKKRLNVKNVTKDVDVDDEYDEPVVKKRRTDDKEERVMHKKGKNGHVVKFSGEEYKSKTAKGDKIIQGKYEPFAYIQLNPKTTAKRNRKEAVEMFKKVMKPK